MSDRFSQLLPILGAIVAFLFAALLLVYIFRLVFGRRIRAPGARNRPRRLDVVDVFDLDRERQLVIVRRDNTEHLLMIGGPNDVLVEASINRVEGVLARTAGASTGWPAGPAPAEADVSEPPTSRPVPQAALNLPPELFEPVSAPEPASTRPSAAPKIEPAPSEPLRPAPPPPRPPVITPAASSSPITPPAGSAGAPAAAPPRAPVAPAPPPRPPVPPAPARAAPPPFLARAQQRLGPAKPETERQGGASPSAGPDSGAAPPRPPAAARPAPPPLRPPPGLSNAPGGTQQPPFPPRPAPPRPAQPPQPPVPAPSEPLDTLEEEMARLLGRPEQE